jgi:ABC-type phosphate/phosphonate transport system substrate-binding protein
MYDWPEVHWANDALWAAIRARLEASGIAAPELLDRSRDRNEVWTDPALVLSQTCAWPYVTQLRGRVTLVGTPEYDADGCADSLYSSFLIARISDSGDALGAFRRRRFAVNGRDSLSGYIALKSAMHAEALGEGDVTWVETGGHRESIRAVAAGTADVAAIDAICWALAGRHEPGAVEQLRVINRTLLRPGLPLITAAGRDPAAVDAIRSAIREALASQETLAARQALFLAALDVTDESDYAPLAKLAEL